MKSQFSKAAEFRELHNKAAIFVTPNPWDIGSAVLLEDMGFSALATTGAGFAFSRGRSDGMAGMVQIMGNIREIANATNVPVTADLENGFGDTPESVATAITLAAEAGVVGASIEDSTGRPTDPLYPLSLAVERILAAVEVARRLPFPFTVTARAENFFVGATNPDLDDALRRLVAYQDAGADVLFAPGMSRLSDIASVVNGVKKPINVMMGFANPIFGLRDLSEIGVRRVSLGGSLARSALGAFLRSAREILEHGEFTYANTAVAHRELNERFSGRSKIESSYAKVDAL